MGCSQAVPDRINAFRLEPSIGNIGNIDSATGPGLLGGT